jgi:hypothetical protein
MGSKNVLLRTPVVALSAKTGRFWSAQFYTKWRASQINDLRKSP